ncbi:hypothetical protein WA556_005371, partial [Blastocystis sp. ATCC 50177/Nand II]
MSSVYIAVSKEIGSLRKNWDESLQKATSDCTNDYNLIRNWLNKCVQDHQVYQFELGGHATLSSGFLSPIKEDSEISPRVSPIVTKSEAAKVVPSTSVAVKKSVPSSPVSSRIPATPSRRDVLFNQFNALSITQLLGELRARSLHTVGTKSELVERLVAHELKGEKPALSSLQSESEEQMRLIQKKEEEHKLKLAGNLGTPVSRLPPSAAKPLGTTS